MKCWICGAEMKNTIGGCYQCENCGIGAVNDLVLRVPYDRVATIKEKQVELPKKEEVGHTDDSMSPNEAEEQLQKRTMFILKKFNAFVDAYRKELFSLTITPELGAVSARDLDLSIFNKLAGDFNDLLGALYDGPPCEGWTEGSDCRTCCMTECCSNRVHSKKYKVE